MAGIRQLIPRAAQGIIGPIMSDLGFNKIAGGVLAAALAITFMNQISEKVFAATSVKEDKMGFSVAPMAAGGAGAAPEVLLPSPDWGTVLVAADLKAGEAIFQKCASCHKPTDENGTGPGLSGVVGRKPGAHAGFKYSDPMVAFGNANSQWTFDLLEKFLTKPKDEVDGTKMTFAGLRGKKHGGSQQDRINVIAYLHTLNSTLAVPAPNAERAAATAAALAALDAPAGAAPAAAPAAEGKAAPAAEAKTVAAAPAAAAAAPKAK